MLGKTSGAGEMDGCIVPEDSLRGCCAVQIQRSLGKSLLVPYPNKIKQCTLSW